MARIYLDYASLTPIDPRVLREMKAFSTPKFANPSSLYKEGVAAKNALLAGRKKVADFLHAHSDEIIFTGSGTEANNLALIGAVESLAEKGIAYEDMHVLVSVIEHSSVRECANYLNEKGVVVDVVGVNSEGIVNLDELKSKIKANTVIVSIMTVNNEIGSIQPIREIAKIIRQARAALRGQMLQFEPGPARGELEYLTPNKTPEKPDPFSFQDFKYPIYHTDAAQAALYEDLNMENMGVDLLTLDSSKVCGPRGIGALYIRRNTPVRSIIHGGGQEAGIRSGTENILGIMGFAKALEIAEHDRKKETKRIQDLKKFFIKGLKAINPAITINGALSGRGSVPIRRGLDRARIEITSMSASPHIVNVSIPGIDSEYFILQLDAKGIACSTKSSCLRDEDESYVLQSIGANSKYSIRFSFGRWTKKAELQKTLEVIAFLGKF